MVTPVMVTPVMVTPVMVTPVTGTGAILYRLHTISYYTSIAIMYLMQATTFLKYVLSVISQNLDVT